MIYKRDYYLQKIQASLDDLERILFVVGARQVGKTTLLKSLIEFGIVGKDETFFLEGDKFFEEVQNGDQFLEILRVKYGLDIKKLKYLIIDEFHFIKNIGLILKNLIDDVRLGKYQFKIIASGSGSWHMFLGKSDALT